jgi:hypothetical protein
VIQDPDLFSAFTKNAWRLETRTFYEDDRAEFERAVDGLEPTVEEVERRARWVAKVEQARAEGRTIGRVLLVRRPLSAYHRWRVETALPHVAAGEDIRLADYEQHAPLAGLYMDFWLLDNARVWVMAYNTVDRFTGIMETATPAAVGYCRQVHDEVLAWARPIQEFLTPA